MGSDDGLYYFLEDVNIEEFKAKYLLHRSWFIVAPKLKINFRMRKDGDKNHVTCNENDKQKSSRRCCIH